MVFSFQIAGKSKSVIVFKSQKLQFFQKKSLNIFKMAHVDFALVAVLPNPF